MSVLLEALDRALAQRGGRDVAAVVVRLQDLDVLADLEGAGCADGHRAAAEQVLARVLGGGSVVRSLDVARLAGLGPPSTWEEDPHALARRVAVALDEVWPSVAVGVHGARHPVTSDELVRRASSAARDAADRGAEAAVYDADAEAAARERYRLNLALRRAVVDEQLVLHYQPVLDLATRRIVSCEALVRWEHPQRGLLMPDTFIPLAEASGAINALGRWVLDRACRDAGAWQREVRGADRIGVAVNVSRLQVRSGELLTDVRAALRLYGLAPEDLHVEVTEQSVCARGDAVVGVLDELHALGVRISLDDFGTGYSSLSQLRDLPVDVLKIDKAFVDGIAREDGEWALASAIVRLACSLGKRTVAEGVEDVSQLAHLRAMGCDEFQGFLFARPLPLAAFRAMLDAQLS